jgi:hypothetical protein
VVWWEVEVAERRGKVIVVRMTMKPSFKEALHALQSGIAFMYAQVTKGDKQTLLILKC